MLLHREGPEYVYGMAPKDMGGEGARGYKIPGRKLAVADNVGGGLVYIQNTFGPTRRKLGSSMW